MAKVTNKKPKAAPPPTVPGGFGAGSSGWRLVMDPVALSMVRRFV